MLRYLFVYIKNFLSTKIQIFSQHLFLPSLINLILNKLYIFINIFL